MNSLSPLTALQKRFGSADWQNWQAQDWVWYDYTRLNPAGTNQLVFFSQPNGAVDAISGLQKNYEQTNLEKSGSFGSVFFILTGIRTDIQLLPKARQNATVAARTDFAADQYLFSQQLTALMNQGVLSLSILSKEFYKVANPFTRCGAGFGLGDVNPPALSAVQAGKNAYVAPSPTRMDTYNVYPIQVFEPEQSFACAINFPAANTPSFADLFVGGTEDAAVNIGVHLEGVVIRPNQ